MNQYFITDDTALAAYLYLCGMRFMEGTIHNPASKRKKFIVYDEARRPELEEQFYSRITAVSPLDYHDARIAVSRFLRRQLPDPRLPRV